MKDKENSTLSAEFNQEDERAENILRPSFLKDFLGQEKIKDNLKVFLSAAKKRGDSLDHTLFYGPPGLGKTTLAQIIAHEMGVGFKGTSGPIISKAGDLAAILTNLQDGDVLFIDEIHRLQTAVEEVLYSAMEDFKLDIIIGEGPSARSIKIDLPNFTLVGATTRLGLLSNPLRDRFGIPLRLNFYNNKELKKIIIRDSNLLKIKISEDGATEIAKRSRGTPRIAIRMLKRVRDFAFHENRVKEIIEGNANQMIWLVEHPPIYTAGISAKDSDLLDAKIPVYKTNRGGKYTYHGPGMRIIYVMIDVKKLFSPGRPDVSRFVEMLEHWIIAILARFGIRGEIRKGRVGIWVETENGEKKIAAIGIKMRKWVSYHGIALNINPDLSNFGGIVPCGISEFGVTSFATLKKEATPEQIDEVIKEEFYKIFEL